MRLRGGNSGELGYVESLTNFVQIAASNTSYDVTGLSVPIISPGGALVVEAFLPTTQHSVATGATTLQLWEDSTNLVQAGGFYHAAANTPSPRIIKARYVTTPGAHTYKLVARTATAGTITFGAGAGFPAWLRVTRA